VARARATAAGRRRWRGAEPTQPASLSAATAPRRPSLLELLLRFSGIAAWALAARVVGGTPADTVVRERTRDALIIEAALLAVVMVLAGVLIGATV